MRTASTSDLARRRGIVALSLARDPWTKYQAFCFWCLIAATATFAMVLLVI